jgi:ribosome-binding factor A
MVGQKPNGANKDFIEHRADFIQGSVAFNELEEATKQRQAILDNGMKEKRTPGLTFKLDLKTELDALDACMKKLHDKLELDKR